MTGGDRLGPSSAAGPRELEQALDRAQRSAPSWDRTAADERAAILERAADLYESRMVELMALIIREGGRTIPAAVAEVREAVDYLRYYALRGRIDFAVPERLPGPTGERDEIALHGRGVFACISPWNFPLAIFTGQIAAALAAGNTVVAKPAEQTPLVAAAAVRLLHEAGIPGDVLHLLPGTGEAIGAPLVGDPRVAGIAFTGSTETARQINLDLARRPGPIVPLIAETGGQNAMIVDSSALRRAGRRRCPDLRFRECRAALLVVAAALCPGRYRRPAPGDAEGSDGGTRDWRSGTDRNRCRPDHRCRGA